MDPPFDLGDDEDDEEDGLIAIPPGDDDEDDEDFMSATHFYHFKQWFTQKEAEAFMKKADAAMEKALDNMMDDIDEDEELDDDFFDGGDWDDVNVAWKGE